MKSTKPNYTITRDTHRIDATGKAPGRLATEIATLLRGKHKPSYTPHVDNGDFVIVENATQAKMTAKKAEQKIYYSHSGYPGGLKKTQMKKVIAENPTKVISKAVYNMLPKTKLRSSMFKRLTVKK